MKIQLVKNAKSGFDAMIKCLANTGFDPDISFCVGKGLFLCTDDDGVNWVLKNLKFK